MTAAVTIHFRKLELTARCVDSLLADGWAPVLVWDNSDDAGISLQTLQARYAEEKNVVLIRSPTNSGFGRGMNAALAALGQQGYMGPALLVNNDACVIPGMKAALLAQLVGETSPVLVAPRIIQDGHEQGWLYYQPWLALVTRRPLPGSFSYLSGCCLLVHRADNARPLFDEDFFMYGEDVELSWRICREGGRLVLLDQAWIHHAGSASSGQASETYERFLVGSHWMLGGKLVSSPFSALVMRGLRFPSLFVRACLRSFRFSSLVPLRALSQVWTRSSISPSPHEIRR